MTILNKKNLLSPAEQEVLVCTQLDSRLTSVEIANALNAQPAAVQRILQKLILNKVITPRVFLNVYRLGWKYINYYFSLVEDNDVVRERLALYVKKSTKVSWFATFSGSYRYGLGVLVKDEKEFIEELQILTKSIKCQFKMCSTVTHISLTLYPKKYLHHKYIIAKSINYGIFNHSDIIQLDAKDYHFIRSLSSYTGKSLRSLAMECKIPSSSADDKVKKWEKDRLISGYWYQVNEPSLHRDCWKMLVKLSVYSEEVNKKLHAFAEQHIRIVHLIRCYGAWDYEIGIDIETSSDFSNVVNDIEYEFGVFFSSCEVLPISKILKVEQIP